jgi:hypothetical protein
LTQILESEVAQVVTFLFEVLDCGKVLHYSVGLQEAVELCARGEAEEAAHGGFGQAGVAVFFDQICAGGGVGLAAALLPFLEGSTR